MSYGIILLMGMSSQSAAACRANLCHLTSMLSTVCRGAFTRLPLWPGLLPAAELPGMVHSLYDKQDLVTCQICHFTNFRCCRY